jgi:transposase
MTQQRLHMKKLRELIRLKNEAHLTNRQVAAILNISASTVSYYLRAVTQAGLNWPLAASLNDDGLMAMVEPFCVNLRKTKKLKDTPNWEHIRQELAQKGVTLQLLYEEYVEQNGSHNFSYSHFCREYKKWLNTQDIRMRLNHEYGDKSFIDFAGQTVPIYAKDNTVQFKAQIFLAVLGGSQYVFAKATISQKLPDWVGANIDAFEFFGGVASLLVPDNLKSAIKDSCKYDPVSNPTYADMALHYGTEILPARSFKPKDKASAENSVLIVERWILARLRKHKFYSLRALNNKIKELVIALNNKPFQKKSGSRRSLFVEHEQAKLKLLPTHRYEIAIFKTVKVQNDYHVCVNNCFYSVPYHLISCYVECRITNNTIEIMHKGQRITSHVVVKIKGTRTTLDQHMPTNHREHKNWNKDVFLSWANDIGPGTINIAKEICSTNIHRDRIYRFHLGLKSLAKKYTAQRLESACLRARAIGSLEYKTLSSILSKKLDLQPCLEVVVSSYRPQLASHHNIRGKNYFTQQLQEND